MEKHIEKNVDKREEDIAKWEYKCQKMENT